MLGWAVEAKRPAGPTEVHLYFDGPAGVGVGYATSTNTLRTDVNSAYSVTGNHGLAFPIPSQYRNGAVHTVHAYAIGKTWNDNRLMASSPQSFQFRPIGFVDSASTSTVAGWAIDTQSPSSSIQVHLYFDGPAGVGTGYAATANVARPDVNSVLGYPGNHGFSFNVPPPFNSGSHSVYVYAIGVTPYNNQLLSPSPRSY